MLYVICYMHVICNIIYTLPSEPTSLSSMNVLELPTWDKLTYGFMTMGKVNLFLSAVINCLHINLVLFK